MENLLLNLGLMLEFERAPRAPSRLPLDLHCVPQIHKLDSNGQWWFPIPVQEIDWRINIDGVLRGWILIVSSPSRSEAISVLAIHLVTVRKVAPEMLAGITTAHHRFRTTVTKVFLPGTNDVG
jgi:hypothetical protein